MAIRQRQPVGVAVLPGKDAEQPQLRLLVDRFVGAVGRGVIKMG